MDGPCITISEPAAAPPDAEAGVVPAVRYVHHTAAKRRVDACRSRATPEPAADDYDIAIGNSRVAGVLRIQRDVIAVEAPTGGGTAGG